MPWRDPRTTRGRVTNFFGDSWQPRRRIWPALGSQSPCCAWLMCEGFFALARLRPNERRHKGHARSAARRPFPQKPVLLGGYDGRFERKMNFLRKRGFFGHRTSAYIPAPNKIARAENPGKSGKIRGGICVLQIGASPAVSRENFPKCEPDRVGCNTIDAIWLILARQTRWVSAGTIVPAGQIPLGANSGIRWVISRVRCGAMQSMASASYADDQARSSEGEKSEPQARRLLTSVGDPGLFKALRPSPRGVWVEISGPKGAANFHSHALWGRGPPFHRPLARAPPFRLLCFANRLVLQNARK